MFLSTKSPFNVQFVYSSEKPHFSGNTVIETKFFDDDLLVSKSLVRLFYA